jgi:hypothetical protein
VVRFEGKVVMHLVKDQPDASVEPMEAKEKTRSTSSKADGTK